MQGLQQAGIRSLWHCTLREKFRRADAAIDATAIGSMAS